MPPVGFELTISAGERPQTYALDRTGTGTGYETLDVGINLFQILLFKLWVTFKNDIQIQK